MHTHAPARRAKHIIVHIDPILKTLILPLLIIIM